MATTRYCKECGTALEGIAAQFTHPQRCAACSERWQDERNARAREMWEDAKKQRAKTA